MRVFLCPEPLVCSATAFLSSTKYGHDDGNQAMMQNAQAWKGLDVHTRSTKLVPQRCLQPHACCALRWYSPNKSKR
jgi:hypothetical protein